MKRLRRVIGVAVALISCAAAPAHQAKAESDAASKPTGDPRDVMAAMLTALEARDIKAVREYFDQSTEEARTAATDEVAKLDANMSLKDAIEKRWGKETTLSSGVPAKAAQYAIEASKKVTVWISPDKTEAKEEFPKTEYGLPPTFLKMDRGAWRIDAVTFSANISGTKDTAKEHKWAQEIAAIYRKLTAEVGDGKYAGIKEVNAVLDKAYLDHFNAESAKDRDKSRTPETNQAVKIPDTASGPLGTLLAILKAAEKRDAAAVAALFDQSTDDARKLAGEIRGKLDAEFELLDAVEAKLGKAAVASVPSAVESFRELAIRGVKGKTWFRADGNVAKIEGEHEAVAIFVADGDVWRVDANRANSEIEPTSPKADQKWMREMAEKYRRITGLIRAEKITTRKEFDEALHGTKENK